MQVKRGPFDHAKFCEEFSRRFPCQHPRAAPCEKIKTNGQRYYRRQCPDCGAPLSAHLKYADVDAWVAAGNRLGEWDEGKYVQIIRERFAASAEIKHKFGWEAAGFWNRYQDYLASDEWRARRRRIFERDGYKCQQPGCNRTAEHVHHLNYDRVGDELDADLTSICAACHRQLHPNRFM